jgi:hypothetical protein
MKTENLCHDCNSYLQMKAERDELAATMKSIIDWWEDDHDFPYGGAKVDPAEAVQWYKRRMIIIANAARASLAKLKGE